MACTFSLLPFDSASIHKDLLCLNSLCDVCDNLTVWIIVLQQDVSADGPLSVMNHSRDLLYYIFLCSFWRMGEVKRMKQTRVILSLMKINPPTSE